MSAIDNLTSAVNELNSKVADVQTVITALKAANNDVAIQAAADSVAAATTALNAAIQ